MQATDQSDRKQQKNKLPIRGVLRTSLIALVALASISWWFGHYALTPGPTKIEPTSTVFIPRGTTVAGIGTLLDEAKLIHDDLRFGLLTKLMRVSAKLPAGEFKLSTNQTPVDVINELVAARPIQHQITIAEGLNISEIADIFHNNDWADKSRFMALCGDPQFINELGLTELESLEGYLFPDTYRLMRPASDEKVLIRKLVNRSLDVWQGLDRGESSLSRHQVFTLASIVEKETGKAEERSLIAAVFLNRLHKKMKLQSDPTVIYGITDFDGALTKIQLRTKTAYNTYQIPGLPPGPICSPGREALQAVLTPADSKYLYFVSKNDGSHHFSKSLREHNRAVNRYQR